MLDTFNLPGKYGNGKVSIFTIPSTVNNTEWHTWHKPRGVSMINFICIGGGGGGGGGFTRIAGAAGGGGGGGGSSAVTRVTIPAFLLPDTLFVQVGAGGRGVASGGGTAGSGTLSVVSIYPHATSGLNHVVYSGASVPGGGTTGTGAAVGSGGSAGAIGAITNSTWAGLGTWFSIAGQAGTNGGAVAGGNGVAQTIATTTVVTMGGTGGGGTTAADFAGGAITAVSDTFLSQVRPINAAAGSNDGAGGTQLWKPFYNFGGMGGGSSNAGIGGNGGLGAYGSGGGGGGAGTTGGKGGDGGNGIVIITCW